MFQNCPKTGKWKHKLCLCGNWHFVLRTKTIVISVNNAFNVWNICMIVHVSVVRCMYCIHETDHCGFMLGHFFSLDEKRARPRGWGGGHSHMHQGAALWGVGTRHKQAQGCFRICSGERQMFRYFLLLFYSFLFFFLNYPRQARRLKCQLYVFFIWICIERQSQQRLPRFY